MEYKDVRTGMAVRIGSTGINGIVAEVDPRRLESGDPIRVQVRFPVTGLHNLWLAPSHLESRSAA